MASGSNPTARLRKSTQEKDSHPPSALGASDHDSAHVVAVTELRLKFGGKNLRENA
jgi:hypothetical protein